MLNDNDNAGVGASTRDEVPDVPDLSAQWFRDIVGFADATPQAVQEIAKVGTESLLFLLLIPFLLSWWRARSGDSLWLTRALLAPAIPVLAYSVSEGMKSLLQQPRPCWVLTDITTIAECPGGGDWSLPSNHATIAGSAAMAILWSSRSLGALAIATALVEAASRVFVGVHFPQDVFGGLALGAVVAMALPLLARLGVPAVSRLRSRSRLEWLVGRTEPHVSWGDAPTREITR